jgi:hypothetical protein
MGLLRASTIKIVRHKKIISKANPYDKDWGEYFSKRQAREYFHPVFI